MSEYVTFDLGKGSTPQAVRADVGAGAVTNGTQRVVLADDYVLSVVFAAIYDAVSHALRIEEIDPLSEHYLAATLADVTNGADATYYYYVDMASYREFGLQLALDCAGGTVTATVEATCQDDGTAPAACTYIDVTNAWFGVASLVAAAGAASAIWLERDTAGATKYIRVKIVANTGGNTGDWALYSKKLY